MKKWMGLLGVLALTVTACGKDPRLAIDAALAGGDRAQAQALLDAALQSKPDRADLHALAYVLAREEHMNGPAHSRDFALKRYIAEYEWLAGHFELTKDYANSDASLRAHGPAQTLLDAAGKSVYR